MKNLIFTADESTRKGAFIICFYIPIEQKVRLRKQLKTVLVKKFHGTASGLMGRLRKIECEQTKISL